MTLHMYNPSDDPLVGVCMAFTTSVNPHMKAGTEKFEEAKAVVTSFLAGKLYYPVAEAQFFAIVGNPDPIRKIQEIISLPLEPLPKPCFVSAPGVGKRKKARTWTVHEDLRLLAGVHRLGRDWRKVAQFVGSGRTKGQCVQRCNRVLNPDISRELWTKEEDKHLLDLVAQYGKKSWTKIAGRLGNRSDVQCRYHFQSLQKQRFAVAPSAPAAQPCLQSPMGLPAQESETQRAQQVPVGPASSEPVPIPPIATTAWLWTLGENEGAQGGGTNPFDMWLDGESSDLFDDIMF